MTVTVFWHSGPQDPRLGYGGSLAAGHDCCWHTGPGSDPARDAEAHRQVRLAAWHPHARTKDGHPSVCHVTRHWLVRSSRSSCHPDGAEHCSLSNAFATKTDDESTRSPAAECRSCAMAESMRYKTFIISARDSSHKYTSQGVGRGCRTFYTNVR